MMQISASKKEFFLLKTKFIRFVLSFVEIIRHPNKAANGKYCCKTACCVFTLRLCKRGIWSGTLVNLSIALYAWTARKSRFSILKDTLRFKVAIVKHRIEVIFWRSIKKTNSKENKYFNRVLFSSRDSTKWKKYGVNKIPRNLSVQKWNERKKHQKASHNSKLKLYLRSRFCEVLKRKMNKKEFSDKKISEDIKLKIKSSWSFVFGLFFWAYWRRHLF